MFDPYSIGDIHIQISIDPEEVACKETNFDVLANVTKYCIAYKSDTLEHKTLAQSVEHVLDKYREHNNMQEDVELRVAVWFTTPKPAPDVQWDEWDPMEDIREMFEDISKPKLTVIKGGKDDDKSN